MSHDTEYRVKLDIFEGPLDLLLFLIKKNEVNVYDIPIALISKQYVEYLDLLKSLNIDVAGEFLLMAATLAHIKSQLLVPTPLPGDEEGREDPRTDLVNQLLEYQRYKLAANELLARNLLNRDTFKREKTSLELESVDTKRELLEISIFNLIEAFSKILKKIPEDFPQEVYIERLTVKERIAEIADLLCSRSDRRIIFTELFADIKSKSGVIVTFLAILEMIKMGLIKAMQSEDFGDITIAATKNLINGRDLENAYKEPDKIDN